MVRTFIVLMIAAVAMDAQITSVATGNWNTASTWDSNYVPLPGSTVVIASGHTVTLDATGMACSDLTISGSLQFSTTTAVDLTVHGDITIASGGVFRVLANTVGLASPNGGLAHTLNLKGNFTHNGTTMDFRTGSAGTTLSVCNITFTGTSTSTVNVPYVSSSNGEFNYITFNKTAPGKVVLAADMIEAGGSGTGPAAGNSGINFQSGIVETGNFKLVYQGSTAAQITGGNVNSYVIGSLGRGMSTSAGSTKDFYVGDASGYRLFTLRSTTAGSATGHLAIVKCVADSAANFTATYAGTIDKASPRRYFQVTYSNTLGGAASMNFDLFKVAYGSDDGVTDGNTDLRVAYSTNARATWTGIAQTTPHTTSVTSPASQITPDAITAVTLSSGSSLYVALGRASGTTTNPLPVELSSFAVSVNQNGAHLTWTTATEVNNAGFTVERRSDADWTPVTFVKGAGSSNTAHSYSFTDARLGAGRYEYRLKQTDIDGTVRIISGVEAVEIAAPKLFAITGNYPNPFNPSTTIAFTVAQDGPATLVVYDLVGREVAQLFNGPAVSGTTHHATFNATMLPSGLYFARLHSGANTAVRKMMLLK